MAIRSSPRCEASSTGCSGFHDELQLPVPARPGSTRRDELLSTEEFKLGGLTFGRGYDPSELTGDSGLGTALELQFQPGDRVDVPAELSGSMGSTISALSGTAIPTPRPTNRWASGRDRGQDQSEQLAVGRFRSGAAIDERTREPRRQQRFGEIFLPVHGPVLKPGGQDRRRHGTRGIAQDGQPPRERCDTAGLGYGRTQAQVRERRLRRDQRWAVS